MWRIYVRTGERNDWQSIWSGDGAAAERDARAQFARVKGRIDGARSTPENMHADSWIATRLEGPGTEPIEHGRRTPRPTIPFGQ
jgi:hypothetical protein